jgi:Predicted nucleotide-binding protein containing TIR-like domain
MSTNRRVFVSGAREKYLDARTKDLREAILNAIVELGYELVAFGTPAGGSGDAARLTWNQVNVIQTMRRCVGAVLLGFPYWRVGEGERKSGLVIEYCHYEGALATMLDLPILALLESGTAERCAFDPRAGNPVLEVPIDATAGWVTEPVFKNFLNAWSEQVGERRDVFLGYSTSATPVAQIIRSHLEVEGVTVIDWARDFRAAGSILSEIEHAAARCSAAILLFTRDELLQTEAADIVPPRDNVLLEAGYFAHAKGKERVLIVREEGVKMPADFGGDIYVPLREGDPDAVLAGVMDFIHKRL